MLQAYSFGNMSTFKNGKGRKRKSKNPVSIYKQITVPRLPDYPLFDDEASVSSDASSSFCSSGCSQADSFSSCQEYEADPNIDRNVSLQDDLDIDDVVRRIRDTSLVNKRQGRKGNEPAKKKKGMMIEDGQAGDHSTSPAHETTIQNRTRHANDITEENDEEVLPAMKTESITLKKLHDHVDNEEDCWGCNYRFGMSKIRGKHAMLDRLYKVYEDNSDLPINHLAKLLSRVHTILIFEPSLETDKPSPPWPPEKVVEHLRDHIIEPRLQLNAHIKDLNVMVHGLKDTTFEVIVLHDGTRKLIPIIKHLKAYQALSGHVSKLFQVQHMLERARYKK